MTSTDTTWTVLDEAHAALRLAIAAVGDGRGAPTPCAGWTVTQVLQHAAATSSASPRRSPVAPAHREPVRPVRRLDAHPHRARRASMAAAPRRGRRAIRLRRPPRCRRRPSALPPPSASGRAPSTPPSTPGTSPSPSATLPALDGPLPAARRGPADRGAAAPYGAYARRWRRSPATTPPRRCCATWAATPNGPPDPPVAWRAWASSTGSWATPPGSTRRPPHASTARCWVRASGCTRRTSSFATSSFSPTSGWSWSTSRG